MDGWMTVSWCVTEGGGVWGRGGQRGGAKAVRRVLSVPPISFLRSRADSLRGSRAGSFQ